MYRYMMQVFSIHILPSNEEVLLRVSEQRNILHEIRKQKANWIEKKKIPRYLLKKLKVLCWVVCIYILYTGKYSITVRYSLI
jgi:hypothetical protein